MKLLINFKNFTINQWVLIDKEYKTENNFDPKFLIVIISVIISLAVIYIYTNAYHVQNYSEHFKSFKYPFLTPYAIWALASSFMYTVPAFFIIKFVFKENIFDYGFSFPSNHKVHLIYLAFFIIVLPLAFAASFNDVFLAIYPFYYPEDKYSFLIWEFVYLLQFVALEFFFRGFFLFSLARYIGSYSVFIMTIPYVMIHFNKTFTESMCAIIAGIALGTLALRTRSIYGGIILHSCLALSMDLFSLMQKGFFKFVW